MRLNRTLAAACVIAVTVGLAACSSSGGSSTNVGPTSVPPRNLVVETSFVLKTVDPARMFEPTGLMIDHVLYDTLLTYKGSNVSTPVPDLATSYTASADAKTYTFTLRQGVKFANGDPVTASDVVYSLMRTKNINGNPSFLMSGITATAPNATTVVLTSATTCRRRCCCCWCCCCRCCCCCCRRPGLPWPSPHTLLPASASVAWALPLVVSRSAQRAS